MFDFQSKNLWLKKVEVKEVEDETYSFKKELMTFLNNVTCHCYRHLAQTQRSTPERIMWIVLHIFNAFCFIYVAVNAYDDFTLNPLVTTVHNTIYPIKNIPFPGVSICPNNRISAKAAKEFAIELSQKDEEHRNESYFLEQIHYLGRVYDYETEDQHLMTAFQKILDVINSQGNSGNVTENSNKHFQKIMERLTPKCDDILLRCLFRGIDMPCMRQYDMIEVRRTQYGFCCSFNRVLAGDDNKSNYAYSTSVTGPDMGLVLLLNGSTADSFYSLFNNIGFNVMIHSPYEYPDTTSGGATEKFLSLGTESFVRVEASSVYSTTDIGRFSMQNRKCLFPDELKSYGGKYTRTDCIVNCRIRSVLALCDCLPFYFPPPNIYTNPPVVCTLQHIPCLQKYRIKWFTIMTQMAIQIEGLEKEMEESLSCPQCYPGCSEVYYKVSISALPLVVSKRNGFSLTQGLTDMNEIVVARIFFGITETWLYKQDVAKYWFEIFSDLGGMFGVLGGFSMISFTEIIYFFLRQIVLMWWYRYKAHEIVEVQIYP